MAQKIYHQVHKLWLLSLVDRFGSFSEAANHARVTLSALSQNLSKLENDFGESLVVRERGKVSLTGYGKKLVDKMLPIFEELDELAPNSEEEGPATLSIGTYESISLNFFDDLTRSLHEKFPETKIVITTSRSGELIKRLRKGELDLVVGVDGEEDSRTEKFLVGKDYMGLFASDSLAPIHDLEDMIKEKGIATLATGKDGPASFYQKMMKEYPYDKNIAVTSDSFETVRHLTLAGLYFGFLPYQVAYRHKGELTRVWPIDEKLGEHELNVIARKSLSRKITFEVVDLMKGYLGESPE